jgi:hypothetical protein
VSSPSDDGFQPADNIAMRITPTPPGLTGSPAPPGPIRFFCHVSVGSTHGYPRFAPLGQFPPHHFVLIGDFDGTVESASTGCSALTLRGSRFVEECPRGAADPKSKSYKRKSEEKGSGPACDE